MSRVARGSVALAVVLCALLGAGVATAADKWERRLVRIESKLEAGEWKAVLEESRRLRQKLVTKVDDAQRLMVPAARTLVLQAIAEANLGRDGAARWHWYAAQSFLDDLPSLDLSAYGRADSVLAGLAVDRMDDGWVTPTPSDEGRDRYRPVKIRRSAQPTYPKALRRSAIEGTVDLEVVIDPSGHARRPKVLEAGLVPTMAFPVLDALGQWQFQAAQRDGRAIAVVYRLRIDYR